MRTFKIKIKTATGTRFETGIFRCRWDAVAAGLLMLGEAEGNVVASEVTP